MTGFPIAVTGVGMPPGRPSLTGKPSETKTTTVRLPEPTRQRIKALVGATGMADFIREAVEEKLARMPADKAKR